MSFVNYSFTALINTDPDGLNSVGSQAVEVRNELDNTLATIYSDNGITTITQTGAATDPTTGVLEFWVIPGYYKIISGSRTEIVLIDNGSRLSPATVVAATASKHIKEGDTIRIVERGNALFNVVSGFIGANGDNIIANDAGTLSFVLQPGSVIDFDLDALIPTDFPDLQSAIDYWAPTTCANDHVINLIVEDGHLLTGGIGAFGGSYSQFKITSLDYQEFTATASQTVFTLSKAYVIDEHEVRVTIDGINTYSFVETDANTVTLNSGATVGELIRVYYAVKLDTGFVGVDVSTIPIGIIGTGEVDPLFVCFNGTMPWLDCNVNMSELYGTGYMILEGDGVVSPGCGVVNAGYRGATIHGNCNMYASNFSGSLGTGLRMQQAARVNAKSAVFDDCCKSLDLTNSAVYVSRASILEFRGGSAQRSGASGMIVRRSRVSADDANFDNAADKSVELESTATVTWGSGSGLLAGSASLSVTTGSNCYAVGTAMSSTGSADQMVIDVGGVITIAGSTTFEGVNAAENNIGAYTNVSYVNAFSDFGMIFFDDGNGTFKITSNANGISQRFADGRMTTFIYETIDTGTIASGAFSGNLTIPTQPDTFSGNIQILMSIIGRTSAAGAGSRVCVDNYFRPNVPSGSAWKIFNTGQDLESGGSGLNCLSVNVSIITHGEWI